MTTEQMIQKIEGLDDLSDCVILIGSFATRKYNLICIGDEILGTDPNGNHIETTKSQFVSEYEGFYWDISTYNTI